MKTSTNVKSDLRIKAKALENLANMLSTLEESIRYYLDEDGNPPEEAGYRYYDYYGLRRLHEILTEASTKI